MYNVTCAGEINAYKNDFAFTFDIKKFNNFSSAMSFRLRVYYSTREERRWSSLANHVTFYYIYGARFHSSDLTCIKL